MLWYQFIPFRKSNQGCPQLFDNLSVGTDVYSIKLHGLAGYLSILLNQQGSHSFECEILQNIGSMLDMVDVRILRDRLSGHFNNFFKSCKSRIATVISGMIEKLLEAQGPAVLSRKTSKCQLWSHLTVGNSCDESAGRVILRYRANKVSPGGLTGKNAEKQGNEKKKSFDPETVDSRRCHMSQGVWFRKKDRA